MIFKVKECVNLWKELIDTLACGGSAKVEIKQADLKFVTRMLHPQPCFPVIVHDSMQQLCANQRMPSTGYGNVNAIAGQRGQKICILRTQAILAHFPHKLSFRKTFPAQHGSTFCMIFPLQMQKTTEKLPAINLKPKCWMEHNFSSSLTSLSIEGMADPIANLSVSASTHQHLNQHPSKRDMQMQP